MSTSSDEDYQSADDEPNGTHSSRLASRLEGLSISRDGDRGSEASASGSAPEATQRKGDLATRGDSTVAAGVDSQCQDDNGRGITMEGTPQEGEGDEEQLNRGGGKSESGEVEYVGGLDNRYVSEDVVMRGDKVELSEEQVKVGVSS